MKIHENTSISSQLGKKLVVLISLMTVVTVCAESSEVNEREKELERGTYTNTILSMNAVLRTFEMTQRALPNNVESLISVSPGKVEVADSDNVSRNTTKGGSLNAFLHPQLAINLDAKLLTANQTRNLKAAGIDKVRYIDINGDTKENGFHKLVIKAPIQGGKEAFVGPVSHMKSIQSAYSIPIPGSTHYGRGFVVQLPRLPEEGVNYEALNAHVAVWKKNALVKAKPDAVLVAFGIGGESTLVGPRDQNSVGLLNPPYYYSACAKKQYGHYIMLVDVNESPACFVACVDARCNIVKAP